MPDDLGCLDEEIERRIQEIKSHKLLVILRGDECDCIHCNPTSKSGKMPAVSTF